MKDWLRFYCEVLEDRRFHTMPAELYRRWTFLLILAARSEGLLPSPADLAFALRIGEQDAADTLAALAGYGLIDRIDHDVLSPHNWSGRQFESDSSTERVRRFRRKLTGNVSETLHGTPPDQTQTQTQTQTRLEPPLNPPTPARTEAARAPRSVAPQPAPRYSPAFEMFWRAYPRQNGRAWPKPTTYAEWQRLKPDSELASTILASVTAWLQGRDWQRGFITRPDRWLKARSWEEPPEPWSGEAEAGVRAPPDKPSKYSAHHTSSALALQRLEAAINGGSAHAKPSCDRPGTRTIQSQLAPTVRGPGDA